MFRKKVKKKKIHTDPNADSMRFYNNRMTAALAMGWTVKEDSDWHTDLVKDNTTMGWHIFIFCICPVVGNLIYDYAAKGKKRILKPIK